jgi:hypothetical protein
VWLPLLAGIISRAVDPDSLNLDLDPVFQVISDPDPFRILGFDDQTQKKKYSS